MYAKTSYAVNCQVLVDIIQYIELVVRFCLINKVTNKKYNGKNIITYIRIKVAYIV